MFFKQKSNTLFRSYESFGYITDNRNFGYTLTNDSENYIGDKIISESGSVFFSVLERKPQSLEELVAKICAQFRDVDISIIKDDAKDFYLMLEQEGFIVSGETFQDCEKNDKMFSYKALEAKKTQSGLYKDKIHIGKNTQDFFEEYFKGKPQLTRLHIDLTSKCNERCLHCYIPHENKINSIDADLFYSILRQCKEMKLLHLTLSGGEPMLHKHFCDFLRKCKEYDFSVNVLTNLTLLNDEIIKEMTTNPLLGVQVSLYSMNPVIHDEITQMKGSFEKTKDAILKLIEKDIPLQISCPIMKQNKGYSDEVVQWANQHNIRVGDDFVLIGSYNHTTQNLDCRLSIDEVKEMINDKAINDAKYLEQIKIDADMKKGITPDDFVCSVCNSSICIAENGVVYPCAGWQNYIVGNVKETSLNDIWDNSEKVKYLRGLRNKDFLKCVKCSDKEYCTICMVRNSNESPIGDPFAINEYFCKLAQFNRKLVFEKKPTPERKQGMRMR